MIRRLFSAAALVAAGAALSGCVIYSGSEGENVEVRMGDHATAVATASPAEAVRAARFEGGALIVRVDSNGCTDTGDFSIEVTDGEPTQIKLVRQTPDLCKALLPDGVELSWSYADLGLSTGGSALLLNPVKY